MFGLLGRAYQCVCVCFVSLLISKSSMKILDVLGVSSFVWEEKGSSPQIDFPLSLGFPDKVSE